MIEKTVEKTYVYNGKILNLRNDTVELVNGMFAKREIIEHSGGASVLCVKDNKVLLVKQYRYAYGEEVLEIPAGKLEKGEDASVTAIRELEEECGVKAKSVKKLFDIYPTPGYTNEIIRIYLATDFTYTKTNFDEGEFLTSEWYDIDLVKEMIKDGRIKDAKTVIAIQNYLLDVK